MTDQNQTFFNLDEETQEWLIDGLNIMPFEFDAMSKDDKKSLLAEIQDDYEREANQEQEDLSINPYEYSYL